MNILDHQALSRANFGNDAPWFEANIPFFECSDPQIQQIYYYRWNLYKAHLRDLGDRGYIVTEFLDNVGWAKYPYNSLNDATSYHIYEGRWLRNRRYVDDYIDWMYSGGGNDRHFSEAIADAVYANYLANGDAAFATKHLDSMQHIYNLWDDHYDFSKKLYYIMPLLDATEYTIASIDASGGKDGFLGGDAFRPTINSFMYGNALAISRLSAIAGDVNTSNVYATRAAAIRTNVEKSLWSDGLQHFIDRYQVSNDYVHYWDPIRGRELAGYTPWAFDLPDDNPKYAVAWTHLLSPAGFAGPYGLRTNEPSYQYYMHQYRYDAATGKPECQWNGPSWPFQTTMVLEAMANLLNDYSQNIVHASDYVHLLKQYTQQHYLDGRPDLQEDYNPDTGKVIVGLARSNHYNHSGYDNLIVTGLAGLRPQAGNELVVNPLVPTDPSDPNFLRYFCLEDVPYHGHSVTIVFDSDGKRYGRGAGLSIYVDGARAAGPGPLRKTTIALTLARSQAAAHPVNLAVNLLGYGYPLPSASINDAPDQVNQSVDGLVWYFADVPNGWTTAGSHHESDWYAIDFGQSRSVDSVRLYFRDDGARFKTPSKYVIQYWDGQVWADVAAAKMSPAAPIGDGENIISFARVRTSKIRAIFDHASDGPAVCLVQMKVY